ncbi:MAG TPA: hypothetical protein VIC84_00760 [Blastocatellia bacterium]|jgi:hypothetical protein
MAHEFGQSHHSSLNGIHAAPPLPRLSAANTLFGAASVVAINNIKFISFSSFSDKLNALFVIVAKRALMAQYKLP